MPLRFPLPALWRPVARLRVSPAAFSGGRCRGQRQQQLRPRCGGARLSTLGAPDSPDDSAHASRALELFLPHASPEASAAVDAFMRDRHAVLPVRTLDEFLLDELHRPVGCPDATPFADEWRAFATGAQAKDRSRVAERAWTQWRGFPTAKELQPLELGDSAVDVVERLGVVRLPQVLSLETVATLRAHVLSERTEGERRATEEPSLRAQLFSRVLSPKGAGTDEPTTRWDIRLPWDGVAQAAVAEALAGELGEAFCALTESDARHDAELWVSLKSVVFIA